MIFNIKIKFYPDGSSIWPVLWSYSFTNTNKQIYFLSYFDRNQWEQKPKTLVNEISIFKIVPYFLSGQLDNPITLNLTPGKHDTVGVAQFR